MCFQTADVKMLVKCLQICANVFINRPQDQILVVHAWKILCRLRTKLCPNFARSRARLCPISFAPCPFPNLAGTLSLVTGWLWLPIPYLNDQSCSFNSDLQPVAKQLLREIFYEKTLTLKITTSEEDGILICEMKMRARQTNFDHRFPPGK